MRAFLVKFLPLSFVLLGCMAIFIGQGPIKRASESCSWPVSKGVVRKSSVQAAASGLYNHAFLYEYAVEGVSWSSSRRSFAWELPCEKAEVAALVDQYPAGGALNVHYERAMPWVSVIEPGVTVDKLYLPLTGLLFIAFGALLLSVLPRVLAVRDDESLIAEFLPDFDERSEALAQHGR